MKYTMNKRRIRTMIIISLPFLVGFIILAIFLARFERATHFAIAERLSLAKESLPNDPDGAIENMEQAISKRRKMAILYKVLLQGDSPYLGDDWEKEITELITAIKTAKDKDELQTVRKMIEIKAKLAKPEG